MSLDGYAPITAVTWSIEWHSPRLSYKEYLDLLSGSASRPGLSYQSIPSLSMTAVIQLHTEKNGLRSKTTMFFSTHVFAGSHDMVLTAG